MLIALVMTNNRIIEGLFLARDIFENASSRIEVPNVVLSAYDAPYLKLEIRTETNCAKLCQLILGAEIFYGHKPANL